MSKLPDKVAAGDETEVQLSPWGVFRALGDDDRPVEQVVDEEAGKALVRAFEGEILVDADHESATGGSTEAMAWVTGLRVDPATGLWATFKWTDKGADAVSARRYRFVSAAWTLDAAGRPAKLVSVALTNRPNIQAKPILNQKCAGGASADQTRNPAMEELKKALGLASDADDAAVLAAVQALAQKVTDLEAAQLNAEADAFAEEHKDKVEDPEVLKNAYRKDKALAEALVKNMKAPAPVQEQKPVCNSAAAQRPDLGRDKPLSEQLRGLSPEEANKRLLENA